MSFLAAETIRRHGLTGELARAAAAERYAEHRRLVYAAVADGRLPATQAGPWLARLRTRPHDAALLDQLAAPPVLPAGAWPE